MLHAHEPRPSPHALRPAGAAARRHSAALLRAALHRSRPLSIEGLRERTFSLAFRTMVYPQIWEDPVVDLEALELRPTSRLVTIASGGCNVLSYLVDEPVQIVAVDLNRAHVALTRLKLCAAREIVDHAAFHRFFASADSPENIPTYDRLLRPRLDAETRAYWDGRDLLGRRRIARFARGFYRFGLLGRFIGVGHAFARIAGADPRELLRARSREEQRAIYERTLGPLFDRRVVKWVLGQPASLYALGIPPVQYRALAAGHPGGIAGVLKGRLERLACNTDIADNYFAWQAFGRTYPAIGTGRLPPYLEPIHFDAVKAGARRVEVRLASLVAYLRGQPDRSLDRYVLLDAQDWMGDNELNALWTEISRTARAGARVIFRTAGEADILPGRVAEAVLRSWQYQAVQSRELARKDRSAIYGGFHLYVAGREAP